MGECADGLVCSSKRRIVKTEHKNKLSGKRVSLVIDNVKVVTGTCVKKEDIQGISILKFGKSSHLIKLVFIPSHSFN